MFAIIKQTILVIVCLVAAALIVAIGTVVVIFCTKVAIIAAVGFVLWFIVQLAIYEIKIARSGKTPP